LNQRVVRTHSAVFRDCLSCMDKRKLSGTDIVSKFTLPPVKTAGWDDITQIRQEVKLRDGKVIVRGQLGVRKTVKPADIVLYHKPSIPLAVLFIFAFNDDRSIFHDRAKLGTSFVQTNKLH
jgi:type I restriction enzyme, R subunit